MVRYRSILVCGKKAQFEGWFGIVLVLFCLCFHGLVDILKLITPEKTECFFKVIEDCAEGFCGFRRIGHTRTDIALFSFGPIKYNTSFGGAVAKVRDENVFTAMRELYDRYPVQSHGEYLKKVRTFMLTFRTFCSNKL